MIEFKAIEYRNFMSVGDNPIKIELNRSPTTLICGHNGAGKSILLEALTFVLFGKSYRGINKPTLVNSTNRKDCVVDVWFSKGSDEYHVTRGISPSKFIIRKNGTELDQDASVRDQQSYFETNILGSDFETFSQLVIVGAASYTPFMRLTSGQRREMVESILDIGVFSSMNKVLKGKISSWKQDRRDVEAQIEKERSEISLLSEFISKAKESADSKLMKKKKELSDLYNNAKNIKSRLDSLEFVDTSPIKEKIKSINSDKAAILSKIASSRTEKNNLKSTVDFFTVNSSCPTCEQSIDEDYKKEKISSLDCLINDIESTLSEYKEKEENIDKKLSESESYVSEVVETNNQIRLLKDRMDSLKSQVISVRKEITDLENEENVDTSQQEEKIKERQSRLSLLKERLADLDKKKVLYDKALSLLRDDGIKASIIKKYIPILNSYVNKYLRLLNFNITFELDEKFNENLKTRYKNEFKYYNFSMGERQRLDLALMFAWLSVARSKNSLSTNLLILDEVEGHLDKSGSDDVLEISENLGEDMNIFVISHKETMEDRIRSIVRFEKIKGFTKIVG